MADSFRDVFGIEPDIRAVELAGMLDRQIIAALIQHHRIPGDSFAEKTERIMKIMARRYNEKAGDMREWTLPGARELLRELQNHQTTSGLLTGNVREIAMAKMKGTDLLQYLSPIGGFGDDPVEERKDLIPIAIERAEKHTAYGWKAEDVVIVGDTPRDIKCARGGGARVIAVATGSYSKEKLEEYNPDLLLEDLTDKDEIIRFLDR